MPRHLQFAVAAMASIAAVAGVHSAPRLPPVPSARAALATENLSSAVCPVVYQLDDSPGSRGYHYIFYGNAFFISRDGYLLTAAHVLSEFQNGGQPSILVRRTSAPPRLLKTEVIAIDLEHDVAILRATPNPFAGPHSPYEVLALSLGAAKPRVGDGVEATALRPEHLKDPHTFELPIADTYPAIVLNYLSIALNPHPAASIPLIATPSKDVASQATLPNRSSDESAAIKFAAPRLLGKSQVQTDLFLFSHEVERGQSGAPVALLATHQVVGIIEGRWLHPAASPLARPATNPGSKSSSGSAASSHNPPPPPELTQGAAIPIPYAIALLQKNHIRWEPTP
jgi:hypothetical protein